MDALTHVFLPLLVAYGIRPDLVRQARYISLAGFGLLADFDKLIGVPGLLHSVVTLVPICLALIAFEFLVRDEIHYSAIASLFTLSHIPLDMVSGVAVPLLYPIVTTGAGFEISMEIVFGSGPLGFTLGDGPISVKFGKPRMGHATAAVDTNTFGLINAFGITSLLAFTTVFFGRKFLTEREA